MMEMNWSRWFRCESSFGLLLVPDQPGVFALAEEVVEPSAEGARRMLAVFAVDETEDLARALSRLFAAGSPWQEKLAEGKCFARYAVSPVAETRHAAARALKSWLDSQRDAAAQVFEKERPAAAERERPAAAAEARPQVAEPSVVATERNAGEAERRAIQEDEDEDEPIKTVAERAVDRVAKEAGYAKVFKTGT